MRATDPVMAGHRKQAKVTQNKLEGLLSEEAMSPVVRIIGEWLIPTYKSSSQYQALAILHHQADDILHNEQQRINLKILSDMHPPRNQSPRPPTPPS